MAVVVKEFTIGTNSSLHVERRFFERRRFEALDISVLQVFIDGQVRVMVFDDCE